jgi:hypothetical protein
MITLTYLLVTLWNILHPPQVLNDFQSKGYHEILNQECGQGQFAKIYSDFDAFNDFIDTHPDWAQKLHDIDHTFMVSDTNAPYGSPPIGYIDQKKSGKSKKKYFHFTNDYLDFLKKNHSSLLADSEELNTLLESLKTIHLISEKAFKTAIHSISQDVDLSKVLFTEEGNILTLVKVVKYAPSDLMASSLHYDFSGLSFLFDNSDDKDFETLLIAPYKENLTIKDLNPPHRHYKKSKSKSSLLLLPGLALKSLQLPIDPTPHAVSNQSKTRYAIIVFAMVPDIKLTFEEIKP